LNNRQEHLHEIYLENRNIPSESIKIKFLPVTNFWL